MVQERRGLDGLGLRCFVLSGPKGWPLASRGLSPREALFLPLPAPDILRPLPTRSKGVRSSTSTSLSSCVRAVKIKSSSTHRTYLVVTWDTARFRPANQPWEG